MSEVGTLWWVACNQCEADSLASELRERGVTNIRFLHCPAAKPKVDVLFDLEKSQAQTILGRVVEEEEWLDEEATPS